MAFKVDAKVPSTFDKIKEALPEEKNHCTVIALAAITRLPARCAQAALAMAGRRKRSGCNRTIQQKALSSLGFKVNKMSFVEMRNIINSYPHPHNGLRSITTHHPNRFPHSWVGQPDMLMFSNGHVAAYVNGKVVDWTIKHSKRVVEIWTIEPLDLAAWPALEEVQ